MPNEDTNANPPAHVGSTAELGSGPVRVQLSRAKGWRMPDNTVKVDRTTKWGNPFVVGRDGNQAECVEAFGWLAGEAASLEAMARVLVPPEGLDATQKLLDELQADANPLRGKNLACWCRLDQPCHADVLLRLANTEAQGRFRRPAGAQSSTGLLQEKP